MTRPRLLDLFSGAGGAAMGYHLAGFDVTGVDVAPQPHYPFTFHQADALEFVAAHGTEFDAIHASPPCQHYSILNAYNWREYPDLIDATRHALTATRRPWVMENVTTAPLNNPVVLCGTMFGLALYRHRSFETSEALTPHQPPHAPHTARCSRNGYLPTPQRPYMTISGGAHSRAWQHAACDTMGTWWMKTPPDAAVKPGIREVCEAIPPAYTAWIGAHLHTATRTDAVRQQEPSPPRAHATMTPSPHDI